MSLNIAKDSKKRVVIVGGGFGGLKLANKLKKSGDRKSTRLNSSHSGQSRMPSSA